MQPFSYRRPADASDATDLASGPRDVPSTDAARQFIAGGTNLVDYMKLGVMRPRVLVDINALDAPALRRIEVRDEGLRLGALVRMSEAEDHPGIKASYPVIAQTLMVAASRQIRNMASLGGNVLQRTRCEYFREPTWACNKRQPGSGCAALEGINREHAVLGGSDKCIATYHGDFAQALIALDASVETRGPNGNRRIPFAQLHVMPGDRPNIETVLEPGELITFIDVPGGPHTRRSLYRKVRDRQSYQFALAAAAVALDLEGDRVRDVRIALGGVATVPWRAREAEQELIGKVLDEDAAERAAQAAFAGAETRQLNAYKVPVGREAIVAALMQAKAMQI